VLQTEQSVQQSEASNTRHAPFYSVRQANDPYKIHGCQDGHIDEDEEKESDKDGDQAVGGDNNNAGDGEKKKKRKKRKKKNQRN